MLTSKIIVASQAMPRPDYLIPAVDPLFASKILRVTNDGVRVLLNGKWGARDSRHKYSKRQVFSNDMKFALLDQRKDEPQRVMCELPSWKPLWGTLDTTPAAKMLRSCHEVQFRPGYPNQFVSTHNASGGVTVKIWDYLTGKEIWSVFVPGQSPKFGWAGEAQITNDGNYTVLGTIFDNPKTSGAKDWFVIVDLKNQRVGPRVDVSYATGAFPTGADGLIGNYGISALGNFVEVKLSSTEQYGFVLRVDKDKLTAERQPMALEGLRMGPPDARGKVGAALGAVAWLSHPDMNLSTAGREVVVGGGRGFAASNVDPDFEKARRWGDKYGNVVMIDLATGKATFVSPGSDHLNGIKPASMQHGSGRGVPGWHCISTEMTGGWGAGELQVIKLDGSREMKRLGLHRTDDGFLLPTGVTKDNRYRCESHPVLSPDGRWVFYASNWQVAASPKWPDIADVRGYVVELEGGLSGVVVTPPVDVTPRYIVDPSGSYVGGIKDTTTGQILSIHEAARRLNG